VNVPLLDIRQLHKRFGARELLHIDALQFSPGASYVLTGDNGAGKSTLLRILAGLEMAQIGEFIFCGEAVATNAYPEKLRREIVYVHQQPYLFRGSIHGNLAYGLRVRGMSASQTGAQVAAAMEWAGVAHLKNTPPMRLSSGEKMRVALARVKVLSPRLYLFDEPTANLDEEGRDRTLALIGELCSENHSVVVACHDREVINLPQMQRLHLAGGEIELP